MKTTIKLGGAVALSLLALAPLAHAQETVPAETQETTKEGGHMMGGDMAGMQGMEGMEGMEGMKEKAIEGMGCM